MNAHEYKPRLFMDRTKLKCVPPKQTKFLQLNLLLPHPYGINSSIRLCL